MRRRALIAVSIALLAATVLLASSQGAARDPAAPFVSTGTGVISGAVVIAGATRTPMRRATMTLTRARAEDVRIATSDEQGRFMFSGLPAGEYLLSASKGGYVATNYGEPRPGISGTPIPLAAGQQFVTDPIALIRGAVIAGRLVSSRGQPIPDVNVEATQFYLLNGERRRRTSQSTLASTTTNAHGDFRLFGLAAGDYVLVTGSLSPMSGLEAREVTPQELAWADERGRGRGPARALPPPGPAYNFPPVVFPGATDENRATVISVKPGEERLNLEFVVPMARTGSITGKVVDPNGAPMPNVTVGRLPTRNTSFLSGYNISVRTDADGRFALTNTPPGEYRIVARSTPVSGPAIARQSLWAQVDLNTSGEDVGNLTLQLRPGITVRGRVVFDGASPPSSVTRANIRLLQYLTSAQAGTGPGAVVKSDGTFEFSVTMMPGTYRVQATFSGSARERWVATSAIVGDRNVLDVPLEISQNDDIVSVIVTLSDRESSLTGTLTDSAGKPAPLFVLMFASDPELWFRESRWVRFTRAGIDGSFDIRGLPAGDYYLSALSELEAAQPGEPSFLKDAVRGAIKITLAEGETKAQDLRIGK